MLSGHVNSFVPQNSEEFILDLEGSPFPEDLLVFMNLKVTQNNTVSESPFVSHSQKELAHWTVTVAPDLFAEDFQLPPPGIKEKSCTESKCFSYYIINALRRLILVCTS